MTEDKVADFKKGSFNTVNGKHCCNTEEQMVSFKAAMESFNTASGKYCCNLQMKSSLQKLLTECFNTVNGKHCCNVIGNYSNVTGYQSFNTVNGKHCCNVPEYDKEGNRYLGFQYRKR